MIYVLTVHWKSDFWVDAQISRLRKHLRDPFRIFAFCDQMQRDHSGKFDYCSPVKGIVDHASKLNLLAEVVCREASEDDVLVFCDSDAFPVRDITEYIGDGLSRYPLVAVQRLENAGDIQPHPCFCMTTVGLWRRIGGDWRAGHTWVNAYRRVVTDVGGNLLGLLEQNGVPWGKLHRSNRLNLHPLFFAVYDGTIYHHGAGSRPTIGGRAVRLAQLSGLEPEEAVRRESQLREELMTVSRRVLEIVWRGNDDDLLELFCDK